MSRVCCVPVQQFAFLDDRLPTLTKVLIRQQTAWFEWHLRSARDSFPLALTISSYIRPYFFAPPPRHVSDCISFGHPFIDIYKQPDTKKCMCLRRQESGCSGNQQHTFYILSPRAAPQIHACALDFGYARTFLRESRKKTLRADNKARAIENRSPARWK